MLFRSYHRLLDNNDLEEKADRIGLIRKVYGIMSSQLLITAFMTLIPYLNDDIRLAMLSSPGLVLFAAIMGLVLSCGISCIETLARTVPMNYILMFAFTICEAYTVSYICAAVGDGTLVV